MTPLTILYIDLNSHFASCEQQLNPNLRGRPVAITAVDSDKHGSCVAASYEAKAFGVKTGTRVVDAKQLCPDIVFLPSRHRVYVRFTMAIAAVLDRMAELERIRSVDEFQLRLSAAAQSVEGSQDLVRQMKAAVATEVGICMKFSAGIGPNPLLAKIAGKLQKPDGCRWLAPENMPDAIEHLALDDLPGISKAMKGRLEAAGVRTIRDLCEVDPRHARLIWRSVEGERFVRSLQGFDVPVVSTERGGYGNSKVLAPAFRKPAEAYLVGRWLVEKSAMRLRRDDRVAARFSLSAGILNGEGWSGSLKCGATQDTREFLKMHRHLWRGLWREARGREVMTISVQLSDVSMLADRSGDMFRELRPAEASSGERVSAALDAINRRFGAETIKYGVNSQHPGFFERG